MPDYDVAIIGAGYGGLHALHHLRGEGLRCRVFEAGSGVGGTWYWNRYPGVRVDLESLEYSYAFDAELQQEWEWTERYSAGDEIRRYLEHVADRFDLRRDIRFDTPIAALAYDEDAILWRLTTAAGDVVSATYVVTAVGFLSARHYPPIPGLAEGAFRGEVLHTGAWPHEGRDFTGQRVGLIGTGSSGVQAIPRIAEQASHLHVFLRSPHWCAPLRNMPMPPEYQARIKARYDELRASEHVAFAGFCLTDFDIVEPPPVAAYPGARRAMDATPQERRAEYEWRWRSGGLCFYNSFTDLLFDEDANRTLQDFFAERIREIVADPQVADLLIPRDHAILAKRLCGENGCYEAFNRSNVTLVDVRSDAIAAFTEEGIRLAGGDEYELDAIVCATGYDAGSGALLRVDVAGRDGRTLKDHWSSGVRTHLGVMSHGFPNLFHLDGPQSPSAFFSPPLLMQYQTEWVGRMIAAMAGSGARTVEPTLEAEDEWCGLVQAIANASLLPQAASQYMGANIPGKPRECLYFLGGYQEYRRRCDLALNPATGELVLGGAELTTAG